MKISMNGVAGSWWHNGEAVGVDLGELDVGTGSKLLRTIWYCRRYVYPFAVAFAFF